MSSPAPLRLRPLEIGDILDEAFRLYRRNFLLLAGVSVAFSLPLAALAGFGFWAFLSSAVNQTLGTPSFDVSSLTNLFVGLGVGYIVYVLLLPFQYGALAYAVCESALGRTVTLWSAFRGAFKRYPHVLGYIVLIVLMAVAFCLFPLWIWILVGWVAILPAMFVENIGLGAAMGRSWRLVQGRWWRTFLIILLVYILNYVVSLALQAFMYLGQALLSIVLSPYIALSIYEAAVIVVDALVQPILIIAIVLIYFDLRVRKEGLDLFQQASRLGAPPAAA